MEGFTLFDAGAVALLFVSSILAYGRGLTRELMAIFGWIGSAYVALIFAPQFRPLVMEIPFLGDYLRGSCELSVIVSFALTFVLGLAIASLFAPLLSSYVRRTPLSGVDQALGFFFGLVRGFALLVVVLIVHDRALATDTPGMVENSTTARVLSDIKGDVDSYAPEGASTWLMEHYQGLISSCSASGSEADDLLDQEI